MYNNGDLQSLGAISNIVGLGIIGGQITGGLLAKAIGKTRWQVMFVFVIGATFLACKFASMSVSNIHLQNNAK